MTQLRNCVLIVVLLIVGVVKAADEITLASVPPVVVKAVPKAGADGVDPGIKEIQITVSKP